MEGMVLLVSGDWYLSFCQGAAVCTELVSLSECKVTCFQAGSCILQLKRRKCIMMMKTSLKELNTSSLRQEEK